MVVDKSSARAEPRPRRARPVSPWQDRAGRSELRREKRAALIAAAARAFRDHGYHNTSLDQIAAAVGVTKPLVYHYVGNKEQLLFECFRTGTEQIRAAFRAIETARLTGRERLLKVVSRYAVAIAGDFGWCMVRAEDQDLGPALSRQIQVLKREVDQGLRRLLRAGIEDGSVRLCDPKMAAFAIAGALNWIAHWHRREAGLSAEEIASRFIDLFEYGLAPRAARD
ncbi:MAG: TetR/AcrR family transcriptional regulator [Gammaproteobacteria bacterium]|nr:TetR/AcrR family transcriptional regulator [Gammaproteobacteria bacterium]